VIVVFARAPVPGKAKTRLIPRLGPWRAARLHARLVAHALRTSRAANCGPVELHATAFHSSFGRQAFQVQRGRDLGERMHRAVRISLPKRRRVILIGSDCPDLVPADLRRADRLLRAGYDAVLAPARDGGYALIALRRSGGAALFAGMPWGSAAVYRETVARLARLGWRWRALRTVRDIDRPEDLDYLRSLRFRAARSRAARR
jgi:rSAM/selenodomain-associated transferase 1